MKKFYKSMMIIAAAAMAFSACNKTEIETPQTEKDFYYTFALTSPEMRSILSKIDDARKRHNPELAQPWEANLYSKIELDITNAEDIIGDTFLKKRLGFLLDYRDTSAVTGKPFFNRMGGGNFSRLASGTYK